MQQRSRGIFVIFVASSLAVSCHTEAALNKVNTIITATADANGNQHPASIGFSGTAVALCLTAIGNAGFPASCTINGQIIQLHNSTSANGSVYLTCNGSGALRCQAKVTQ
jgi:hypothetical protein